MVAREDGEGRDEEGEGWGGRVLGREREGRKGMWMEAVGEGEGWKEKG